MTIPDDVRILKPEQLAWLKRPELGPRVWELPDGRLYSFSHNVYHMAMIHRNEVILVSLDKPLPGGKALQYERSKLYNLIKKRSTK